MMKRRIGYFAVMALLAVSAYGVARAADAPPKFEEHKQEMLQHLDQEITLLQNAKTCLTAAKDHDAAKKCHEDMRQAREKLNAGHREMRKKDIDEHIKKLQDEKAKMDADGKK